FYAVSIAVLVGWFWGVNRPEFGVLGILVMTWGDGLAGLVGKRFGRHRYQLWGMEKSWEGSLTMAIVATLVSALILSNIVDSTVQLITIAFTVGILSAVLEAFSNLGIDNLTVPILSAAIAYSLVSII
ncbi:MAG: phosphatidate cytidylyltransferase, partial [Cyanobacteria bacterium CAN_BIN43]|nr:phosphatidate cytidylyltransferase [Cyanobacteria bacterium CAN_BIN43]